MTLLDSASFSHIFFVIFFVRCWDKPRTREGFYRVKPGVEHWYEAQQQNTAIQEPPTICFILRTYHLLTVVLIACCVRSIALLVVQRLHVMRIYYGWRQRHRC